MKVWLPAVRAGSGSDVYVRRLADALPRHGVEATVTWLPHWLELAPVLARATPPRGTTLIHAHSWNAFAFARFGLPLVATVHSPIHAPEAQPYKSPAQRMYHALIRQYERASLRRARGVVAVSAAVARSVGMTFPGTPAQVIHNWVDTANFSPQAQAPRRGPFRLLFAGNRTVWKGWDLLADLMARLGEGFRLQVAGGLRSDSDPARLPPHAELLGRVEGEAAMARVYHGCDAVLVPSRLEGFGYVAAEAMACGKPVIAFDSSALPELISHGESGLLVPTGDVDALAAACRQLAGDAPLAARLGQAARVAAEEKFSEAVALPKYVALYAQAAR